MITINRLWRNTHRHYTLKGEIVNMKKVLGLLLALLMINAAVFASPNAIDTNKSMVKMFNNLGQDIEFKKLSPQAQKEIKKLVSNPKLLNSIFNEFIETRNIDRESRMTSADFNKAVVRKSKIDSRFSFEKISTQNEKLTSASVGSNSGYAAMAQNVFTFEGNYTERIAVSGFTLFQVSGYVIYNAIVGQQIVSISDANIFVVKNYFGTITNVSTPTGSYISGNKAYARATVTFGGGPITNGTSLFEVWGDYSGREGGSFTVIN